MRAIERRLRERITALEQERDAMMADRQLFREHFARRFRWWIQLLGEGKHPDMKWLIEADAKEMIRFQWWVW